MRHTRMRGVRETCRFALSACNEILLRKEEGCAIRLGVSLASPACCLFLPRRLFFLMFGDFFPVKARLDAIDWKILKELQADGRMTNVELASRVGISAPPCLRRVRALEDMGIIRGYRALLAGEKLGYGVTVFALVHLASQAEADLNAFSERVRHWPVVRECHTVSGDFDFVMKCVAPDLASVQHFVSEPHRDAERAQMCAPC